MISKEIVHVKFPLWVILQKCFSDRLKGKIYKRQYRTKSIFFSCCTYLLRVFCPKSSSIDVKLPGKLDVDLFCVKPEWKEYVPV